MNKFKVTIIVVPRERFSYTQQSLDSIYQNTSLPFKLIYVDVNSPPQIKRYLKIQAREKKFQLIRVDRFLTPNQARNLALKTVDTEYVLFIDNDVLVKPGWLEKLVDCADRTKAWIVGPLCLEGDDFAKVHMAGGSYVFKPRGSERWMIMRRPCFRTSLSKVRTEFRRQATQAIEFHCVLVRRQFFEETGLLDEQIMGMGQEDDLCLTALESGKQIYFEPSSVITYVPPQTLMWSEMPFFYMRWNRAWCEASINRMREKWNLAEDAPVMKNYQKFVYFQNYLPEPHIKNNHNYIDWIAESKINLLFKKIVMRSLKKIINWQARLNLNMSKSQQNFK